MKKLLILALCSSSAFAVIDGKPLDWESDYTNMVAFGCTGTIIGGKYFITAEHCSYDPDVRFSNNEYINVLSHNPYPNDGTERFPPDVNIWELERAHDTKDIIYVANLNSDPVAVGDTVTMYGFGGYSELSKGYSKIINTVDNLPFWYKSGNVGTGLLEGGDSGGPWTNSDGDMIGISRSVAQDKESMTATSLAPIKNWVLERVNAWHYPSLAYVNGTETITIQSLHSNADGVDFSLESNETGDAFIVREQSTCLTKAKVFPFEKCTIVVESHGGEGTIQLSNNEFIKLNKLEQLPKPEVMPTPDSGGSLGMLSLFGLIGLGFCRRKVTL